jgi:hypothetical protein
MNYDIKKLKNASWWDKGKPTKCILIGSGSNINAEWFREVKGKYELTEAGIEAYKRLLANDHSIKKRN